jgi:kynureninase
VPHQLPAGDPSDSAYAAALDAADPIASYRDKVRRTDPGLVYLDGNSLGMLPLATQDRLASVVAREWGDELVRGWQRWIDLPTQVGDHLGEALLGAAAGQVLVCDSTTVNLYKLARAAVAARPDRPVVVTDDDNFPTDRYVIEGVAAETSRELRMLKADPVHGVTTQTLSQALAPGDVGLVSLSHVAYRSGALLDMAAVTRQVHDGGALMLWDVAHSAGTVPVELDNAEADFAVGCTYKYLNAGPGAPGFLYVSGRLIDQLRSPIQGWWGQAEMFEMGPTYEPAPGITRFLSGTPSVTGLYAVDEGVRLLAEAGVEALRSKSILLTEYVIALADAWLQPHRLTVASPRNAAARGGHVVLAHPEAYRMAVALIERGVVPDFRAPNLLRLGPAPLTTSFAEVHEGMRRLRDLLAAGEHELLPAAKGKVT